MALVMSGAMSTLANQFTSRSNLVRRISLLEVDAQCHTCMVPSWAEHHGHCAMSYSFHICRNFPTPHIPAICLVMNHFHPWNIYERPILVVSQWCFLPPQFFFLFSNKLWPQFYELSHSGTKNYLWLLSYLVAKETTASLVRGGLLVIRSC